MSETYKLGDICTIGSSKRVHLSDYVNNGVPFFRSKEIIELANGQNISEPLYISNEQYDEIKRRFPVPKKNDILITSVGTIGVCYLVKDGNFYFKDGNLTWLRDTNKNIVDIVFLIQWLKSNYFKRQILNNNIGAVQKAITIDYLKKVKITLPDLPTQQKIASVLSALDDKIELNNRINAELEAMAKTLYDYWFVQFDFPVASTGSATTTGTATEISGENVASTPLSQQSDKKNTAAERSQQSVTEQSQRSVAERSRGYKSSGGKMVYNEILKREIPEGWEVKSLGELVKSINTGLNPRDHFKLGEGENFYVTIKNIEYGRIILDNTCDRISNNSLDRIQKRSNLEKGDILFTSIEPVGKTYLLQENPTNWNINESVFSFKPNYKYVTSEFLFMLLSSYEIRMKCKNAATGSIHKGIRITPLKNFQIPLPPLKLITDFNSILKEILFKINNNQKQNQELSALRDWLLPMLMNGQVKVGMLD